MATIASRRDRGMRTQQMVAERWRQLYPYARAAEAGVPGPDLTATPGVSVEIKARKGFSPLAWMKQAAEQGQRGDLPVAVIRPDGAGPATIDAWPVIIPHGALLGLLKMAGFGHIPGATLVIEQEGRSWES